MKLTAVAVCLALSSASAFTLHRPRALAPRTSALRSTQGDTVTGVKFEEEDEKKNPEKRPGHQVKGMAEIDPETAAKQQLIRDHQQACPRLSWPEEIRTIMSQPKAFATLSTLRDDGFPLGSIVGFAVDAEGSPIFCFSGMSAHTKNILKDKRASLCVTETSFQGAADARTTFVGTMKTLSGDECQEARDTYVKSHPNAYWAQFGDFNMFKLAEVKEISFVGGFARAGGIGFDEYTAAEVDPCAAFAEPVMAHMNDDHAKSLEQYLGLIPGLETTDVERVEMKRLDRFGFDVRVLPNGGVLRIPFDEEVTERKGIKNAIVALSQKCAAMEDKA